MKKRYDAVIVGGGIAGYALATLCAKAGHILFFENEDPPVEPPWERPLLSMADGSVWKAFVAAAEWKEGPAAAYRFQQLDGRTRDDGKTPPLSASPAWDPAPWLAEQFVWQPWYIRFWRSLRRVSGAPANTAALPWSAAPQGFASRDTGVLAYLEATRGAWKTPEQDMGVLLRKLRAVAAAEGAEFLPISRFEGFEQGGVRVQGAGRVLETPRAAACLDLGQWTQAPGLGALPRMIFKHVKPEGIRVRVRWTCDAGELPVGLAGRGWWADSPQAFFEVTGEEARTTLTAWTYCADATRVDPRGLAGQILKTVRSYAPFFRGTIDAAQIDTNPVWQSSARDGHGLPPMLTKILAYAGPQSFPGWGTEGELAAVLRLFRLWYPPAAV